jgi:hypothetical protein
MLVAISCIVILITAFSVTKKPKKKTKPNCGNTICMGAICPLIIDSFTWDPITVFTTLFPVTEPHKMIITEVREMQTV